MAFSWIRHHLLPRPAETGISSMDKIPEPDADGASAGRIHSTRAFVPSRMSRTQTARMRIAGTPMSPYTGYMGLTAREICRSGHDSWRGPLGFGPVQVGEQGTRQSLRHPQGGTTGVFVARAADSPAWRPGDQRSGNYLDGVAPNLINIRVRECLSGWPLVVRGLCLVQGRARCQTLRAHPLVGSTWEGGFSCRRS